MSTFGFHKKNRECLYQLSDYRLEILLRGVSGDLPFLAHLFSICLLRCRVRHHTSPRSCVGAVSYGTLQDDLLEIVLDITRFEF